jgi:uncharacterized protein (TIGR02594 family)
MATVDEKILIAIEARQASLEKQMARAERTFGKGASNIERRSQTLSKRLNTTFSKMNFATTGAFKNFGAGLIGGIAAGLTADKMKGLLDASTQITNALKVAGLSGAELDKVYQQLYQSAQRNSTPLDALVTLYSRVSSAQKELGVSSAEVLTLTDNVAKAIRLSGGSAQEASGALLQLSQALGGGKLQAEEYNSLVDGLRPLLQAAAAGMKQAGGSVAELTRLVKAGEVSSRAFFDAVNAGAPILDQKLANATLTTSQGFVQIYNSLIDAARKFDETTNTSQRLGSALGDVATAISDFNVDHAVEELERYVRAATDAIHAANNFANALGKEVGLDKVGEWIAGLPGLNKVLFSWNAVGRRMDGSAQEAPDYLKDYIARTYGNVNAAGKTDRLPAAPTVTNPVDITAPEYKVLPTATGKGNSAAKRAAEKAAHDLDQAIANQTGIAVDAVSTMLGMTEKTNRGDINAFLARGGVNLDAATTAWCAAFVNSALAQVGVKGTGTNVATDFLNWGNKVDLSKIQRGDVLVNPHGASAGQTGGHVGLATGNIRVVGDQITQVEMISGNASDSVQQQWVNASDVIARRASTAFQLPADALKNLGQQSGVVAEQVESDMDKLNDASREFVGGLAHDLMNGVAPADALRNAFARLADTLLDQLLDAIFQVKNAGGGGLFGNLFSGLFGGTTSFLPGILSGALVGLFADGGHVSGPGSSTSDSIPAMLSDGEFVVNAAATRKHRALLERINNGATPGFASGGAVGGSNVSRLTTAANFNGSPVTIAPVINMNATGGTPEQNADLAKQTSKAVENSIRGIVAKEIATQLRPGNMLNTKALGR